MDFLGLDFWASYIPQMGKVTAVQPHRSCRHKAAWRVAVLWIFFLFSLLSKRAWKRSDSSLNLHVSLCSALYPTKDFLSSAPFVITIDSTILIVNRIYKPGITFRLKLVFKFLPFKLCLNLGGDFCLLFRRSDPSYLLAHQKACQIQALQY